MATLKRMKSSGFTKTKHAAIADGIRAKITSGELAAGDSVPSESELVKSTGASRGTVRRAIATLIQEGLIHTSQGRRPTVSARAFHQSIDSFFSFSSWVRSMGKRPGQYTVEIARRRTAESNSPPASTPDSEFVVELIRLRLIDDKPVMVERTTFHDMAGRFLLQFDTDSGSIYEHLIGNDVPLDEADHVLDVASANEQDSELLDVEVGTPLLCVKRTTYSHEGAVLEYSEDRYRPDRVNFVLHNSRSGTSTVFQATRTERNDSVATSD